MAAAGAAPEDGAVADGAVARLWLHAQQRLADRVAHEIRNALNGASVNVAALHGRLERSAELGGRALQLSSLASEELGRSLDLVEALLAMARPVPRGAELRAALAPVLTLSTSALAADGRRLTCGSRDLKGVDGLRGDALRGALALAIERGAASGAAEVSCDLADDGDAVTVEVRVGAQSITLSDAERDALAAAGVGIVLETNRLALRVPRAAE